MTSRCFLLLVLLSTAFANVNGSDTTRFTDFHIHTSFKHFYRDFITIEDLYAHRNDIPYLRRKYGRYNWTPFAAVPGDRDQGNISTVKNYNQSDFAMLVNTPGSILCTSLYPYEKQFAIKWYKRRISNKLVSGIPMPRLREIGSKHSWPMKEFEAEYAFLQAQEPTDLVTGITIELARNRDHLREILSRPKASAQILTIEGGQVLYGPYAGAKKRVRLATSDDSTVRELMDNVEKLRNLPHKVFFVTPSHFTDNRIAGFAKTIDRPGRIRQLLTNISKSVGIRKSFFTKFGEGIHGDIDIGNYEKRDCEDLRMEDVALPYTSEQRDETLPQWWRKGVGEAVIRALLRPDRGASKRILIDVKHFDIQARYEYYNLLHELNQREEKPIPIIAGHVAVSGEKLPVAMATGLSPLFDKYQEIMDPLEFYRVQVDTSRAATRGIYFDWLCRTRHLTPSDRAKYFIDSRNVPESFNPFDGNINEATAGWFYPWSINLCDEEIALIYESNGIIGLNFDERILGGGMINYSQRYKDSLRQEFTGILPSLTPTVRFTPTFEEYFQTEPMLRNVFYLVHKSTRSDKTAWHHIALGSDFDGLIDPVNLCPTALQIPSFHSKLVTYMEAFWRLHSGDAMFEGRDLFFGGTITYQEAVQRLFFQNGYEFVMNNF